MYIGREPQIGNYQICDAISVVNGQAAYTMQVGSVNVNPESAINTIVSLNGTIQKANSSYTIANSVITFSSNLVTGDVIDFILILGSTLDLGVPSDNTVSTAKIVDDAVTAAKINNDIISGSTELATAPADTDEFLVSDAGTLKRIDYSLIKSSPTHVLLGTTNVTSSTASVTFASNIDSTYKNYLFTYTDVRPVTDGAKIQLRVNSSIGSPDTGGSQYRYAARSYRDNGDLTNDHSNAASVISTSSMNTGSDTSENLAGEFILHNPSGTSGRKVFHGSSVGMQTDTAVFYNYFAAVYTETTVAVTGVQFFFNSGNIARGTFKFYGIS